MNGRRSLTTVVGLVGILGLGSAAMSQCGPVTGGGGTSTTTTTVAPVATTVAPTTSTTTATVPSTTTTAAATTTTTIAPPPPASAPLTLLLSQSAAFSILGHSCGGIQEQAFANGFDVTSGDPTGDVYLQTRCGGSGRGGGYTVTTYASWVAVTWDFGGTEQSYAALTAAPTGLSPTFSTADAAGDQLTNVLTAVNVLPADCTVGNTSYCTYRAYLTVVPPAVPTGVTAVQVGDQLQVDWVPSPATAAHLSSSTVTATPQGSTSGVLTATVIGPATSALVASLQPLTTYQVTVVNSNAGGTSPASDPVTISTPASTVVPEAPTGVAAHWTAPQAPGDTLVASWNAAVPGDSPVDQYQVTVSVNDPGNVVPGPFTQTVSGSTLGAGFVVDDTLDWTVEVQAHNAAGWGPMSAPVVLPAA